MNDLIEPNDWCDPEEWEEDEEEQEQEPEERDFEYDLERAENDYEAQFDV